MSSITVADVREKMSDTLNRVSYAKERVVITRHGKEQAAIVPLEDIELLNMLEAHIDLEEARKALKDMDGAVNWEEFKGELDL